MSASGISLPLIEVPYKGNSEKNRDSTSYRVTHSRLAQSMMRYECVLKVVNTEPKPISWGDVCNCCKVLMSIEYAGERGCARLCINLQPVYLYTT